MQNEALAQKFLNKIDTEGAEEVLKTAPAELLRDKDFVLAAVSNEGYALKYASRELQNDPDALAAISE